MEANVEKFRQLDKNLKSLGEENIKDLEKLQARSRQVMRQINEDKIRHEKEILQKVFDHLELLDKEEGFTEEEFNQFWQQMPNSYHKRFKETGLTFDKIAGDDGIIDQEEFTKMVDELAEEEGMAGGSYN